MITTLEHLSRIRGQLDEPVVATSGGFDPLHVGHVRCILEMARLGKTVVVILNTEGFLKRKKGYVFMPDEERLEIIDAIRGVDYVVTFDDGTQFSSGAIAKLRPNIFAKGGDRQKPEDIPEWNTCQKAGCRVVFNVGGEKVQSSSGLVRDMKRKKKGNQ